MEVDEISSDKIYIYVYRTDPTKIDFRYNIQQDLPTKYKDEDPYIVTNHGSDHTETYKISKPSGEGERFYMKIKARNFKKGQKISVESTASITDIYLIIGIVLGSIVTISLTIIILPLISIYKIKRDKSITETNEDVIIEKVSWGDSSPLK